MQTFDALDLNLLKTLDTLLRERSVTRAARALGLSQSALSHRLRNLREMFDDPLFVSGSAGLVATERAAALEGPLRDALASIAAVVQQAAPWSPQDSTRRFVVLSSDYGEFTLIPKLLREVQQQAPRVELVIEPPRPDPGSALEDGSVDLLIGPPVQEKAGLRVKKLGEHAFVVAHRTGHPLAEKRLTLSTYAGASHLLVAPRGSKHGPVDDALAARGMTRHVALTTRHFAPAGFIVAQSDLLWTAPAALAEVAATYVELRLRSVPLELEPFPFFMAWHERSHADPAHVWLRQLLERALR
ncbi:MAG: LysR family transcriptional regulator [Polyangiaceae bacterium]